MKNLPSIYVQREKYPFLPDDVFMPIEAPIVTEYLSGKYAINKLEVIKNIRTEKILKQHIDASGYSNIVFFTGKRKTKTYRVHRILAFMFLYCNIPEKDAIVNHIDSNRENNSLSNLEWTTIKENNNRKNMKPVDSKYLIEYIGTNSEGIEVERFNCQNIPEKYNYTEIRTAARYNSNYMGLIWSKTERKKFIPGFSGNLDDYIWDKHWKYENVYTCKEGYVMVNGKLSSFKARNYLFCTINNKEKPVHRVIAENYFKKELKGTELIDHIDRNTENNNISNLRICSPSENLDNKNTLKITSDTIVVTDLFGDFLYKSYTRDVYKFIYGTEPARKGESCGGIRGKNGIKFLKKKYICFKEGDADRLISILKDVIYRLEKVDNSYNIIGAYLTLKDASRSESGTAKFRSIRDSINKNIPAMDNFYYITGDFAINTLISSGHLTALDPENNQPLDI